MSLYTPAHFATSDRPAVARLMHDHAFATLVTPGTPLPLVSHLPLVHRFEHDRAEPWTFAMPPRQRDAMVGAIVAFRMHIKRLDAKFKLSQNRTAEDRGRVAAGLRTDGYAEALNTAAWMEIYAAAKKDAP